MNGIHFLLLLSCDRGPAPADDCDPLVPDVCGLPWPSDRFLIEDPDTPSGWRVDLGGTTLPQHHEGAQIQPTAWNRKDGFSTWSPLVTWLPELDPSLLPSHVDLGASLTSTTLAVVDLDTGERWPVWAELDATPEVSDRDRALLIHPARPFEHGHAYAVGLAGLTDLSGAPIAPSDAFVELRDGLDATRQDTEDRRDLYEARVFPALADAGLARDDLQLAWSFRVVSEAGSLGEARWMRDDAASRRTGQFEWTDRREGDCETEPIALTLEGNLQVPHYVDSQEPPAFLSRDADGAPQFVEMADVPFLVRIPCSVLDAGEPVPALQYGHGLFQSRDEIKRVYLGELADEMGWVLIAADWTGLSNRDTSAIVQILGNDATDFAAVPERTLQAYVSFDALRDAAQTTLLDDPELGPLLDGSVQFLGISQGAVLGGGYLGFSEDLDRGVLNVPGSPFTVLLPRSVNYVPFRAVLESQFPDPRHAQLVLASFQTVWDPAETAGWTHVLADTDTLLLQTNLGDAQVSTLAAQNLARAVGATLITPAPREVWGLDTADDDVTTSAYVEWLYTDGSEEPVDATPPSEDGDTHTCSRREHAAWLQMRDFYELQTVVNHCDGVCTGTREGFCDERPE